MSLKVICRTCLCPTSNKSTISDAIELPLDGEYESKPFVIVDLLKSFARIDFLDTNELPQKICNMCINQIKRICTFVANCEKNEKILKHFLTVETDETIPTLKFKPPIVTSSMLEKRRNMAMAKEETSDTSIAYSEKEDENSNEELLSPLDSLKMEIKTEMPADQEGDPSECSFEEYKPTQLTTPVYSYIKEEPELELESDIINLTSSDSDDDVDTKCEFSVDVEDELATFYTYVERSNARLWCAKCEGHFPTKQMYDAHLSKCMDIMGCDGKRELDNHYQTSDNTLSDGEIIIKRRKRSKQSKKVKPKDALPFTCPYCPKSFSVERSLDSHIKCHNKSHMCPKCMKSFRSGHHLKAHNMRVHGATWKSIHCGVCKRYFACNADFVRHQLTHTKEKPYECNICPERYRYKKFLENHIKQSHPEVSEEAILDYIKARYGGKKLPELLDSTFTCIVCGMNVDRANLAEHVNSHKRYPI